MELFNIHSAAAEKIIIVAHRGVSGGNIPCNTIAAYEIALKHGADMIEIDLNRTKDGKLVIFHPGMERAQLNHMGSIRRKSYDKLCKSVRYVNFDRSATEHPIESFDDVLETFKGRCFINTDKFWDYPDEISKAIRRHNMTDQIIVKSTPDMRRLRIIEECASDMQFLPIISEDKKIIEKMNSMKLNWVGAEVLFKDESSPLCGEAFRDKMHKAGKLLWVNAIVYNYRDVLAAGHSDDEAMCSDKQNGWGWLADRGFDIIQTDWPFFLSDYLYKTGRLYK